MDFGQVPEDQLALVDFNLPAEPLWNQSVLNGSAVDTVFRIGSKAFASNELIKYLYPPKTAEEDYLREYSKHFDALELNTPHYKLPKVQTVINWTERIQNPNFRFCSKFYQGITHRGPLKGKALITQEFISSIGALGKYIGPLLFQLADTYSRKRKDELYQYLSSLPSDLQVFLELRHKEWFEPIVFEEVCNYLKDHQHGLVITDSPGRRDALHMHLTVPTCFIRFSSCGGFRDYERLNTWIERLKIWKEAGLKEGYFFIHGKENGELHLLEYMKEKIK